MDKSVIKSKSFYVFIGCIILSLFIVGATYAYFTASVTDDNTVTGDTATVSFGLVIDKVTSSDMAFGLIPMYDERAPYAANNMCLDDLGNPVCQIYRINVVADGATVMFLDGYIEAITKEGVDVAFTRVYPVFDEEDPDNIVKFATVSEYDASVNAKSGVRGSTDDALINRDDDANCLFLTDEKIGGTSQDDTHKYFYVMVWLHDTGVSQDDIQGMSSAYRGKVIFITSQGNEISATFD